METQEEVWAVSYLGACGIKYGGVSTLWCPGNALHHVLVLSEFSLALFGCHDPHTHRLVIRATGNQSAVLVGPHHTNPLPVARESLHTVTNGQKIVKESSRCNSGCDEWKYRLFKGFWREALDQVYPVATSHIFMVLSLEAEMMWSPFGMMATDETLWSCPEKQKRQM